MLCPACNLPTVSQHTVVNYILISDMADSRADLVHRFYYANQQLTDMQVPIPDKQSVQRVMAYI